MHIKEFNNYYKQAQKVKIVDDVFFKCAGWFWLNLTERQHKKMYKLMLEQGAKEVVINDRRQILLSSGLGINKL